MLKTLSLGSKLEIDTPSLNREKAPGGEKVTKRQVSLVPLTSESSAQCSIIVLKGPAQLALCLFMDLCYRKRKLVGVSQPVNNREKGAGQRD